LATLPIVGYTVSLAELLSDGFILSPDEVVAITERLIHQAPDAPQPPFGPLTPERIQVSTDGAVLSHCAATPTVAELAILMQDLLAKTPHVPGGLRYAIARALHEVDAPPFDSLEEFAATLARHAPRRRDDTLRRLITNRDRRRPLPSPSDLRLQLRDADRRLYESQPLANLPPPAAAARRWIAGALLAGAVMAVAAAALVGDPPSPPPLPAPPALAVGTWSPRADSSAHVVIATTADSPQRLHAHPKQSGVHTARPRAIRLRWLHKTIAIKDDLRRP
jgi:hypothetical protein